MPRPNESTKSTWECPKCKAFYHSPVYGTLGVSHQCPKVKDLSRGTAYRKVKDYDYS